MRLSREGCERAFAELVKRHRPTVFGIARKIAGRYDDACDITQVVFIKAYQKLHTFRSQARFFSWIYRIAVNESLNFVRSVKRQKQLSNPRSQVSRSPEEKLIESETEDRLQSAMMRIDPRARALLVLRYFADLSYHELSFVFDIPQSTVKSRLHEARCTLSSRLRRCDVVTTN